jgi:hypothetical protein
MKQLTPRIEIEGRVTDFIKGAYTSTGGLTAATLQFTLPLQSDGYRKLWNKEVTFFVGESKPIFRGYIKRVKENFNEIEVFAQDIIGYMVLGGNAEKAKIALTDTDNLDGLTAGAAIKKAIDKAQLSSKIGTDVIGDTSPLISSSRPPLRGTLSVNDIIKELVSRAVDNNGDVPLANIVRVVDDGNTSQLIIELDKSLDSTPSFVFTEKNNILDLKIISRKIPTIVIVNGYDGVKGTFVHDSAISANDRNYLEVTNEDLKSPAECKDFASKIFRANIETQYEYGISTYQGLTLSENDIIRIDTDNELFSGNYRVRGKKIAFSRTSFTIGLNINRKPPTLAEYIVRQDN